MDITIKADLAVLENLKKQRAIINEQITEFRKLIVERHCQIKPGDEVVCNSYSHTGKKMVVDSVLLRDGWSSDNLRFAARGKVLRADGSVGKLVGEWSEKVMA